MKTRKAFAIVAVTSVACISTFIGLQTFPRCEPKIGYMFLHADHAAQYLVDHRNTPDTCLECMTVDQEEINRFNAYVEQVGADPSSIYLHDQGGSGYTFNFKDPKLKNYTVSVSSQTFRRKHMYVPMHYWTGNIDYQNSRE